MSELRALIAAAGRGTRAGLPYPKTLFPIGGQPILLRIAKLLAAYDERPTVIVSPEGEPAIRACLNEAGQAAEIAVQQSPRGMGDAVLCFEQSPAAAEAAHVLLIWGDIPFIQPETLAATVEAHLANGNDFTFATRVVNQAYTFVSRDKKGVVTGLAESREAGIDPGPGERDIGLFVFRTAPVMALLREEMPGKYGQTTGEHGFLYVVEALAARGHRVEGLAVAQELDLVSLNSMSDIASHLPSGVVDESVED